MKLADKFTYRVTWSEDDGEFVGLCAEFPSLSFLAENQVAALKGIHKVVADVLKDMKKTGEEIPEPFATRKYSGEIRLRLPPNAHRQAAINAAEEGVSLNRYIIDKVVHR